MTGTRIDALRSRMESRRLDALVVHHLPHIRYLTGFSGSNALLAVFPSSSVLLTDSRYTEQVRHEVRGTATRIVKGSLFEAIAGRFRGRRRPHRIGIQKTRISAMGLEMARKASDGWTAVSADGMVEDFMAVKDRSEVALIRKAAAISGAVFTQVLHILRPGIAEADVAAEISYLHRTLGADADAFEPIVASGVRGALPHARASRKRIRKGELVTLDFGCRVDGYHSDMTRTVAVGRISRRLRTMYEAVLAAQLAALAAVRAGVPASVPDRAARNVLRSKRLVRRFTHSLGHGLGLEVHESPRLAPNSRDVLVRGSVVTIEPGVYVPRVGGVRIEDDVVVTDEGIELLTHAPKHLITV